MKMRPMGDRAVIIYIGEKISEEISNRVHTLRKGIEKKHINGIYSIVPGYCTLTIHYDPLAISYETLSDKLKTLDFTLSAFDYKNARLIKVPVLYGDKWGIDLSYVAKYNNISEEDVIDIHSGKEYLVYMLGFSPGFTYLGELDPRVATPRLKNPRLKVPKGAIGIADRQTGIYAVSTPGGWRIIGRTPYNFFTPDKSPYTLVKPGDRVKFYPIDRKKFEELSQKEIKGKDIEIEGEEIFEVKNPGPFTIVVDKGRYGYEDIGLSPGGPMDDVSYRLANRLIGNLGDVPSLEVTMGGLTLIAKKETLVSFVGGEFVIFINNTKVDVNNKYLVRIGDIIKVRSPKKGIRLYVSIPGGINVPYTMGSASTDIKAGIGGMGGRTLKTGDIIYAKSSFFDAQLGYAITGFEALEEPILLRTIPGPNLENFKKRDIELFYSSIYKITNNADRMGYRLEGPKIGHSSKGAGIISEGVVPGAIQIPGEGFPIVMMKDAQPLGGYAKIGTIISPDLRKLGQAPPGSKVKFVPINIKDIQPILDKEKKWEKNLLSYIGKKYRIIRKGVNYNIEIEELK